MARSLNKVMLIGNLGKDPELKNTASGTAVATFSMATNRRYKDKDGEWQDDTQWHNIVAWSNKAETITNYCKKGSRIYIEGRLTTRSWDDKDGQKKYMTEIITDNFVLLDPPPEGAVRGEPIPPPQPPEGLGPQDEDDVPF
ncbi:single-stranded DNA-binding protein [bacterium]|nr:single-stranded DNA-binding protein [bacterium]MBU1652518.1 single-stranded DNA-binding protein [bacterium]MBU1882454.1 single-stranded DNA-binding protein [bacterium]